MDESKSIWNKTTAELTVKDQLIVTVGATVIVTGGLMAAGAAAGAASKVADKVREIRANRKNKNDEGEE